MTDSSVFFLGFSKSQWTAPTSDKKGFQCAISIRKAAAPVMHFLCCCGISVALRFYTICIFTCLAPGWLQLAVQQMSGQSTKLKGILPANADCTKSQPTAGTHQNVYF